MVTVQELAEQNKKKPTMEEIINSTNEETKKPTINDIMGKITGKTSTQEGIDSFDGSTKSVKEAADSEDRIEYGIIGDMRESAKGLASDIFELGKYGVNRFILNKDSEAGIKDYKKFLEYQDKISTADTDEAQELYNKMINDSSVIDSKKYSQYTQKQQDSMTDFEKAKEAGKNVFNQKLEDAVSPYITKVSDRYGIDVIGGGISNIEKQYSLMYDNVMNAYNDTRDESILNKRDDISKKYEQNIIDFTTERAKGVSEGKDYGESYKNAITDLKEGANDIVSLEREMQDELYKTTIKRNFGDSWDAASEGNILQVANKGALGLKNIITRGASYIDTALEEAKQLLTDRYDVTEELANVYAFKEDATGLQKTGGTIKYVGNWLLDSLPQLGTIAVELVTTKKIPTSLSGKLDKVFKLSKIAKDTTTFNKRGVTNISKALSNLTMDFLVYDPVANAITGHPITGEEENLNLLFNGIIDTWQAAASLPAKYFNKTLTAADFSVDFLISENALNIVKKTTKENMNIMTEELTLLRGMEKYEGSKAAKELSKKHWTLDEIKNINPELANKYLELSKKASDYAERMARYEGNVNDMLLALEEAKSSKALSKMNTEQRITEGVKMLEAQKKAIKEMAGYSVLGAKASGRTLKNAFTDGRLTEEEIKNTAKEVARQFKNLNEGGFADTVIGILKEDANLVETGAALIGQGAITREELTQAYNNIVSSLIEKKGDFLLEDEWIGLYKKSKDGEYISMFSDDGGLFSIKDVIGEIKSSNKFIGENQLNVVDELETLMNNYIQIKATGGLVDKEVSIKDVINKIPSFDLGNYVSKTTAEKSFIDRLLSSAGATIKKDDNGNVTDILYNFDDLVTVYSLFNSKRINEFNSEDLGFYKLLYAGDILDSYKRYANNLKHDYSEVKFAKEFKTWFEKLFDEKGLKQEYNVDNEVEALTNVLQNNGEFKNVELKSANIIVKEAITNNPTYENIKKILVEGHYDKNNTEIIMPVVNALYDNIEWLRQLGLKGDYTNHLASVFSQLAVDEPTIRVLSLANNDYLYKSIISKLLLEGEEGDKMFKAAISNIIAYMPTNTKNKSIYNIVNTLNSIKNIKADSADAIVLSNKIQDSISSIKEIKYFEPTFNKNSVVSFKDGVVKIDNTKRLTDDDINSLATIIARKTFINNGLPQSSLYDKYLTALKDSLHNLDMKKATFYVEQGIAPNKDMINLTLLGEARLMQMLANPDNALSAIITLHKTGKELNNLLDRIESYKKIKLPDEYINLLDGVKQLIDKGENKSFDSIINSIADKVVDSSLIKDGFVKEKILDIYDGLVEKDLSERINAGKVVDKYINDVDTLINILNTPGYSKHGYIVQGLYRTKLTLERGKQLLIGKINDKKEFEESLSRLLITKPLKKEEEMLYNGGMIAGNKVANDLYAKGTNVLFHDDLDAFDYKPVLGDNKRIVILDTETTGKDKHTDEVWQLTYKILSIKDGKLNIECKNVFYKTKKKLSDFALNTIKENNIDYKKQATKLLHKDSEAIKELNELAEEEGTYFVAHNVDFDNTVLSRKGLKTKDNQWIDTLGLVRGLFPITKNKKQETLVKLFEPVTNAFNLWKKINNKEGTSHNAEIDTEELRYLFTFVLNHSIKNNKVDKDKILQELSDISNKIDDGGIVPNSWYVYKLENNFSNGKNSEYQDVLNEKTFDVPTILNQMFGSNPSRELIPEDIKTLGLQGGSNVVRVGDVITTISDKLGDEKAIPILNGLLEFVDYDTLIDVDRVLMGDGVKDIYMSIQNKIPDMTFSEFCINRLVANILASQGKYSEDTIKALNSKVYEGVHNFTYSQLKNNALSDYSLTPTLLVIKKLNESGLLNLGEGAEYAANMQNIVSKLRGVNIKEGGENFFNEINTLNLAIYNYYNVPNSYNLYNVKFATDDLISALFGKEKDFKGLSAEYIGGILTGSAKTSNTIEGYNKYLEETYGILDAAGISKDAKKDIDNSIKQYKAEVKLAEGQLNKYKEELKNIKSSINKKTTSKKSKILLEKEKSLLESIDRLKTFIDNTKQKHIGELSNNLDAEFQKKEEEIVNKLKQEAEEKKIRELNEAYDDIQDMGEVVKTGIPKLFDSDETLYKVGEYMDDSTKTELDELNNLNNLMDESNLSDEVLDIADNETEYGLESGEGVLGYEPTVQTEGSIYLPEKESVGIDIENRNIEGQDKASTLSIQYKDSSKTNVENEGRRQLESYFVTDDFDKDFTREGLLSYNNIFLVEENAETTKDYLITSYNGIVVALRNRDGNTENKINYITKLINSCEDKIKDLNKGLTNKYESKMSEDEIKKEIQKYEARKSWLYNTKSVLEGNRTAMTPEQISDIDGFSENLIGRNTFNGKINNITVQLNRHVKGEEGTYIEGEIQNVFDGTFDINNFVKEYVLSNLDTDAKEGEKYGTIFLRYDIEGKTAPIEYKISSSRLFETPFGEYILKHYGIEPIKGKAQYKNVEYLRMIKDKLSSDTFGIKHLFNKLDLDTSYEKILKDGKKKSVGAWVNKWDIDDWKFALSNTEVGKYYYYDLLPEVEKNQFKKLIGIKNKDEAAIEKYIKSNGVEEINKIVEQAGYSNWDDMILGQLEKIKANDTKKYYKIKNELGFDIIFDNKFKELNKKSLSPTDSLKYTLDTFITKNEGRGPSRDNTSKEYEKILSFDTKVNGTFEINGGIDEEGNVIKKYVDAEVPLKVVAVQPQYYLLSNKGTILEVEGKYINDTAMLFDDMVETKKIYDDNDPGLWDNIEYVLDFDNVNVRLENDEGRIFNGTISVDRGGATLKHLEDGGVKTKYTPTKYKLETKELESPERQVDWSKSGKEIKFKDAGEKTEAIKESSSQSLPNDVTTKIELDNKEIAKDIDELMSNINVSLNAHYNSSWLNLTNYDIYNKSDTLKQIVGERQRFLTEKKDDLADAIEKFNKALESNTDEEKKEIYKTIKDKARDSISAMNTNIADWDVEELSDEVNEALKGVLKVYKEGGRDPQYQLLLLGKNDGFETLLKNTVHNHTAAAIEFYKSTPGNVQSLLSNDLKQFTRDEKHLENLVKDIVGDPLGTGKLYQLATGLRSLWRFVKYGPILFPLSGVLMLSNSTFLGATKYASEANGVKKLMNSDAFNILIGKKGDKLMINGKEYEGLGFASGMDRLNEIMFNSNSDLGGSWFDKVLDTIINKLPERNGFETKFKEAFAVAMKGGTHSLFDMCAQGSVRSMELAKALEKNLTGRMSIEEFVTRLAQGDESQEFRELKNVILGDMEKGYSRFFTNSATTLFSRHRFSRRYIYNALQGYVINRTDEVFSSIKDFFDWYKGMNKLAKTDEGLGLNTRVTWHDFVNYISTDNQELQALLMNVLLSAKIGYYMDRIYEGGEIDAKTYANYMVDTSDYLSAIPATFFYGILTAPIEGMLDYAEYTDMSHDNFNVGDGLKVSMIKTFSEALSRMFREGKVMGTAIDSIAAYGKTGDAGFAFDVLRQDLKNIADGLGRFQLVEGTNKYGLETFTEERDLIGQILFNADKTTNAGKLTNKLYSFSTVDSIVNGEDGDWWKQQILPYIPVIGSLLQNAATGEGFTFSAAKWKELQHILDTDNVVKTLNNRDLFNENGNDIWWNENYYSADSISRLYKELTEFDYPNKSRKDGSKFNTGYEGELGLIKEEVFTDEILNGLGRTEEDLVNYLNTADSTKSAGLMKIMAACDANNPGSSKIVISYLANKEEYDLMKQVSGKDYPKTNDFTDEQMDIIKRKVIQDYYPYMFLADKTSRYKAITEYVSNAYPLFESLYKDDDITGYVSTLGYMDMIMYQQAKDGNVNAKYIKNSWSMLSKYMKTEESRMGAIDYVMNTIENSGFSRGKATSAKVGVLSANIDFYDKIQKNALMSALYGEDIEKYNNYVWGVLEDINQIGKQEAKKDLSSSGYSKGYSYNTYNPYGDDNEDEVQNFVPKATEYVKQYQPNGKTYSTSPSSYKTYSPEGDFKFYWNTYESLVKAYSDKLVKSRSKTYPAQYQEPNTYKRKLSNSGTIKGAKLSFPKHESAKYSTAVLSNMPGSHG